MITVLHHSAHGAGCDRQLLIMLPGVGSEAAEFAENGMVTALHGSEPAIDVVAVRPDLALYHDGGIVPVLHQAVVEPALAQGYTRIWLLGISLGGMGALLYASAHGALVEGLILLAPFLGTRGTIAELTKAKGLHAWPPADSIATAQEARILLWLRDTYLRDSPVQDSPLQDSLAHRPQSPVLYLGYGTEDRFAAGHRILARVLPEDHVVAATGGHDWDTWATLWRGLLDRSPFAGGEK